MAIHGKIQQPTGARGGDYINRKGYYSILFQRVCNYHGTLKDVFNSPSGIVHAARKLWESNFFQDWDSKIKQFIFLVTVLISQFPFIISAKRPRRGNGSKY